MFLPILGGLAVFGGLAYLYNRLSNPGIGAQVIIPPSHLDTASLREDGFSFPEPDTDVSTWPIVTVGNDRYRVAPSYIGPVGIGEAKAIANARGMQLPTPELVDAIWRAADLKVTPVPEAHDGTPRTMSSPSAYLAHKRHILAEVDGRNFTLLGGTHKDVVQSDKAYPGLKVGGIGLYGWHAEPGMTKNNRTIRGGAEVHAPVSKGDGLVIQQPFGGHGLDWIDYSQGVRLVKKIEGEV